MYFLFATMPPSLLHIFTNPIYRSTCDVLGVSKYLNINTYTVICFSIQYYSLFLRQKPYFFIISVLQCFFTCTWCRPTCRRRTRFLPEFNHLCWRWEESALWFKPGNTLWIQSNVWVENKTQVTWKYKVISAFEHEVKQRRLFQSTPQPGATVYTLC